jgi:PEGA domain-containing protein
MNPAPTIVPDPNRTPDGSRSTRRYTPSFSDGFGDRLLTFDNSTGMSLELLRFKKEFSDVPAFEKALRERVEQLAHFHHPSIAVIRGVERIDDGEALAVVSKLTPGRRLSDLLPKAKGPVFALELARQLTPALAALQAAAPGVTHGALTAERIVVAREGRLVLVDHVLGSAIQALRLPVGRLRSELGLVLQVGPDATHLNDRNDVIQLGFVALSLLLGRNLDPADYPGQVGTLLDEFIKHEPGHASTALRQWLERALQVGLRPFANAKDAQLALSDLPEEGEAATATDSNRTLLAFRAPEHPAPAVPAPVPAPAEVKHSPAARKLEAKAPVQVVPDVPKVETVKPVPPPPPAPTTAATGAPSPKSSEARPVRASNTKDWVLAGVSVLAALEAVAIAGLLYARPETITVDVRSPLAEAASPAHAALTPTVTLAPPPVQTAAAAPEGVVPAATRPADTQAAAPAGSEAPAVDRPPADRAAAAGSRFGGVRVSSPIELQVYEAGRLLGSTAGPIAINDGPHDLEVVNEALGFRFRQSINVRPGQLTGVTINVPNGRISINAAPWAEVIIDGNAAGQTPLANLSLPIGTHEIVFRHPQFPEQRQTVVVKADGLTRVSATMQR